MSQSEHLEYKKAALSQRWSRAI